MIQAAVQQDLNVAVYLVISGPQRHRVASHLLLHGHEIVFQAFQRRGILVPRRLVCAHPVIHEARIILIMTSDTGRLDSGRTSPLPLLLRLVALGARNLAHHAVRRIP